jgi:hypothetical protein
VRTALAGGLLGAALFVAVLGTAIVRPSNLGWTMRHDLQTYVLAWTHFRHEPWRWPPGRIDGIGYPVGTSIGNTDAIPVVAFALKPLQALLPEPSQYLGAWLLLCFVLQGVFGVLLLRLATPDWRLQLLGAALFVQTPALFNRLGHPALCAHWVLLASIWLLLDGTRAQRRGIAARGWRLRRSWRRAADWPAWCCCWRWPPSRTAPGVPPRGAARRAGFAADSAAAGLVMGGVFWLCGYFLVSSRVCSRTALGLLSMNLLGPIMGMGYTMLLPSFRSRCPASTKGTSTSGWAGCCSRWRHSPVCARAPAHRCRGWAGLAGRGRMHGHRHQPGGHLRGDDTRRSARLGAGESRHLPVERPRFGWVTMYTVLTFVALALVTRLPRPAALAAFALAFVVQAVDMSGAYRALHAREHNPAWTDYDSPVKSAAWTAIVPAYRHLVMAPPDMCAAVWAPVAGPHLPFSLLAGTHGVTINSGNAGRYDTGAVLRHCAALEADLRAGTVSDDSVYVLSPAMRAALGPPRQCRSPAASSTAWTCASRPRVPPAGARSRVPKASCPPSLCQAP